MVFEGSNPSVSANFLFSVSSFVVPSLSFAVLVSGVSFLLGVGPAALLSYVFCAAEALMMPALVNRALCSVCVLTLIISPR